MKEGRVSIEKILMVTEEKGENGLHNSEEATKNHKHCSWVFGKKEKRVEVAEKERMEKARWKWRELPNIACSKKWVCSPRNGELQPKRPVSHTVLDDDSRKGNDFKG